MPLSFGTVTCTLHVRENAFKVHQPDVNELVRFYTCQQRGGGLDDNSLFYKSTFKRQRGGGLGSIFGSIARTLLAYAKQLLSIAKEYLIP